MRDIYLYAVQYVQVRRYFAYLFLIHFSFWGAGLITFRTYRGMLIKLEFGKGIFYHQPPERGTALGNTT